MMKSEIQIVDSAEACHIDVEGTIGVPEEWQFEVPEERVATYEKFREALRRIAEIKAPEVIVNIRSTGGDVNDALLIHDALRTLDARITTRCYGYTASAATIIAQAATEGCRELSANALYLIHNAVCATEGNAAELESRIELLRQTDARIADIYANRSGRPVEEFEALMAENHGNGRWLSPDETIAAGLADRIVDATEQSVENCTEQPRIRGWKRLLANMGLGRKETFDPQEMPADRNVLHFDEETREELQRRSQLAAAEARAQFGPTTTLQREDPSHGETLRTANERAYAEDVKCFQN